MTNALNRFIREFLQLFKAQNSVVYEIISYLGSEGKNTEERRGNHGGNKKDIMAHDFFTKLPFVFTPDL